jgi:hypothetical protein
MHLYRGTTEQFIGDAVRATLANQLAERFFEEFRYKPSPSEVTSWHNSLSAMSNALQSPSKTVSSPLRNRPTSRPWSRC